MAGESAQEKYEAIRAARRERVRSRRWRLLLVAVAITGLAALVMHLVVRAAWLGVLVGGFVAVGNMLPRLLPSQRETAWRRGAEGERLVALALEALSPDVRVLHDRRIPGSRANIDHILIAPAGVWLVDAKNYQGRLEVRARGRELWINGRNRTKLLESAHRQADVVRRVLASAELDAIPVHAALCFVGVEWPLFFKPKAAGGIALTRTRRLQELMAGDTQMRVDDVGRVEAVLRERFRAAARH